MNTTDMLHPNSHNTLAIRYSTPQGMHINLELMGSVLLPDQPLSCSMEGESCAVNVLIAFTLPVGVFVDPYELKVRE